jgi:hypothetical protein
MEQRYLVPYGQPLPPANANNGHMLRLVGDGGDKKAISAANESLRNLAPRLKQPLRAFRAAQTLNEYVLRITTPAPLTASSTYVSHDHDATIAIGPTERALLQLYSASILQETVLTVETPIKE